MDKRTVDTMRITGNATGEDARRIKVENSTQQDAGERRERRSKNSNNNINNNSCSKKPT